MVKREEIEKAYKEFDEFYEEAELPPYNAAYRYFEAGVRWLEKLIEDKNKITT